MSNPIGFEITLDQPYDDAMGMVTDALQSEGFGILTTIDVRATLKEKLGEDFRPYAILGACNPPLAHRALSHNPEVGLLLPCNVTLEQRPDGGTIVRIGNPEAILGVGDLQEDEVLCAVASEARARLARVAAALESDQGRTARAARDPSEEQVEK